LNATRRLFAVLAVCALAATPALAVIVKAPSALDALSRTDPSLVQGRQVAPLAEVASALPNRAGWETLRGALGPHSEIYFDLATGEPAMVKGAPEPFIPGAGNGLTLGDVGRVLGRQVDGVDEAVMTDLGGRFLDRNAALFRVPRAEIVDRSAVLVNDNLWVVTFLHAPGGIPVAGSRITLVIGHGNLILWGSEKVAPVGAAAPRSAGLSVDQARQAVAAYVGWDAKRDRWVDVPELVYLPASEGAGALSLDVAGSGHRLVWELELERRGETGLWLAHVDAVNGEVLEFGDSNRYGWIRGGIEPNDWRDVEENRPLGNVRVSDCGGGGSCFSSIEGLFLPGTTPTASLNGQLVTISNRCGTPGFPSLAVDGNGNANFGTGPPNPGGDADCTTNGVGTSGGAHNTHAARSAYYHITRSKDKGRSWLPANGWLSSAHEVRVNIADVCNAYWSPSGGLNGFFQEGFDGGLHCFNTGEIAGVFLHEVGHGLDQNDAQGTADGGTGEAYGDTLALVELHESCMGDGFWNQQCTGYGLPCTDCTGVRDADYAKHNDGGIPVAVPFTPANYTGPHCPGGFFGVGPCGKEVHCEAYPISGAIYDLAARKLVGGFDLDTAWLIVERDWMRGMQIATSAFTCNTTTFASNGCAATSWFQAMLAADDDDGNLANGTPHAAYLFQAFNDHAIACGAAGDAANQNSSACPALAAPVVSATAVPLAGPESGPGIDLSWGSVTGAVGYQVLKNHGGCSLGYQHVATVSAPTTAFVDSDVVDHQPYSFRVVALGAAGALTANSCYSDMSNCATASITSCPNATGSAPGLTNPTDNQVVVTWDNSGTCASFNVYRRQGTCAAGGAFTQIATAQAGPTYTDLAVSGGITYAYELSGLDPTGSFETGRSPCAEITPTGACNESPTFDPGLTAINGEGSTCGIDLAWGTGSTTCPAQSVVYNVYRDTVSGFTPGDGNRIASGETGTTYHDADVDFGVEYFYVVRAEALTGVGGGPNGGVEDLNTEEASEVPTGPFIAAFEDDLEAGTANWAASTGSGASPWTLVTTASHSPTHAWFVPDTTSVNDQRLATVNPMVIGAGAMLRFWHQFNFESDTNPYDGGVVEYSTNNGSTWQDVLAGNGGSVPANPARFIQNGYLGTISSCCSNPLAGRMAYTGSTSGFVETLVDLTDFNGQSVRFRWRFGSDSSVSDVGWWVDDVDVVVGQSCIGSSLIFLDGFESGNTSAWSVTVP
jgi:hypothetical protein